MKNPRRHLVSAINDSADTVRAFSALNEAIPAEGDWIRIAPYGEHPNKVGLQVFDQEAARSMVTAFNSVEGRLANLFRGLPIYEGHPDDAEWRQKNPGIKTAAVGRVKKLDAREDGLWAQVAWNERGDQLVHGPAPAYTAQSPHWGMIPVATRKKVFRPVELFSLGLTNQPNITGTQLGLNETDTTSPMKELLIKLLAAIGVPVAADAADDVFTAAYNEALQKLDAMKNGTAEAANAKTKMEGQLAAAANEVATLKTAVATERRERATLVVASAINEGRLTEAQRTSMIEELVSAQDFGTKAGEIAQLKKAVNTTNKLGDIAARKAATAVSQEKISAINEAVNAYIKQHGLDARRDYDAAWTAVKGEKPELFAATNG